MNAARLGAWEAKHSASEERGQESGAGDGADDGIWEFHLYIAGQTSSSANALRNLKRICDTHLRGRYTIKVVDLSKHPQLAKEDRIIATPTLIRRLPQPLRRLIGDLSNTERVLVGLNLKPANERGE